MSWKSLSLGDALSVKHGFAFKSTYFSDRGSFLVLTPGNFNEHGGFRLRTGKDRWYTGRFPEEYILSETDIIVAMTEQGPGLLGSSAIVPEGNRYLHNQRLGLVTGLDESVLDRKFTYYLFNTKSVRGQISSSASGTKVRHTSPDRIYRVRVRVPGVESQARIAEVISAYDDLIENNRRRIALLDQAARELYREWFVRLRFPGHGSTRIADGLPEGWEKANLGDIVPISKGKNITKGLVRDGHVPVVAGGLSPAYYHDTPNVLGPVVTISASGANAGHVNIYHEDIWASDCSFISASQTERLFYFYLLLRDRQREILGLQRGAAQPHVYPKDLARLIVLIPRDDIVEEFLESVSAKFGQMGALNRHTIRLVQARDLLLPRLMSGEVAV